MGVLTAIPAMNGAVTLKATQLAASGPVQLSAPHRVTTNIPVASAIAPTPAPTLVAVSAEAQSASHRLTTTTYRNEDGDTVSLTETASQYMDASMGFTDMGHHAITANNKIFATDSHVKVISSEARASNTDGYSVATASNSSVDISFDIEGLVPGAAPPFKVALLSSTSLQGDLIKLNVGVKIGDNAAVNIFGMDAEVKYGVPDPADPLQSVLKRMGQGMSVSARLLGIEQAPGMILANASPVQMPTFASQAMMGLAGGVGDFFAKTTAAGDAVQQATQRFSIGVDAQGHVLDPSTDDVTQAAYHVNITVNKKAHVAMAEAPGNYAQATAITAYTQASASVMSMGGAAAPQESSGVSLHSVVVNDDSSYVLPAAFQAKSPVADAKINVLPQLADLHIQQKMLLAQQLIKSITV